MFSICEATAPTALSILPSRTPSARVNSFSFIESSSLFGLLLPAREVIRWRCSRLAGSCAQQNSTPGSTAILQGSPSRFVALHGGINSHPPGLGNVSSPPSSFSSALGPAVGVSNCHASDPPPSLPNPSSPYAQNIPLR